MKKLILGLAVLGSALSFLNCGKNNVEHAPACPYGQILTFDGQAYSCRNISLTGPQGFNQPNNQQVGMLSPPISQCPNTGAEAQELVYWVNTYYCMYSSILRPNDNNSPKSQLPPQGKGGEFCTSAGLNSSYYYNNNYNNNYNNTGYNTGTINPYQNVVSCQPGYQCQANGQSNYPGMSPVPGQTQYPQYPNNTYQQNPYSAYGTPGVCTFSGYRG